MDVTQLAYWIQGMLEFTNVSELSEADLKIKLQGIKDHTALVFNKVTPTVVAAPAEFLPKRVTPTREENEQAFKKMMDRAKQNPLWDLYQKHGIDPSTWKTSPVAPSPYNPWVSPPYTSPYYMQSDFPFEAGKTMIMC